MNKENKKKNELSKIAKESGINFSTVIIGSLVGLAMGGPVGSLVGVTTSHSISTIIKLVSKATEKRKIRAQNIVLQGFTITNLSEDEITNKFLSDEEKINDFVSILKNAIDNDKNLDDISSILLSELIISEYEQEKDRIFIFNDAIRSLRSIHIKVLKSIDRYGGTLSAKEISKAVSISEIELRSVVRTLELKGLIKDCEKIPVEWTIRELGKAIIEFAKRGERK